MARRKPGSGKGEKVRVFAAERAETFSKSAPAAWRQAGSANPTGSKTK